MAVLSMEVSLKLFEFPSRQERKTRQKEKPQDARSVVRKQVPTLIRQMVQEIVLNRRTIWSPAEVRGKILVLQSKCPHTLLVERKRAEGRITHGYARVCLICDFFERATEGIGTNQKPIYAYRTLKGRPLIVTRVAGNFTIDILSYPLEEIVEEIFEYQRGYRNRAKRS